MKVRVEIEFEKDVDVKLVPSIISNRDSVQLLGANIVQISLLTMQSEEI